ncbi:MAG: amino acid ABC transporter substrate-binding protein [Clostridiaceae bacterium]
MKKIIIGAIAIITSLTLLAGCSGNNDKNDETGSEKETLTIGFDQDFPPYGYVGEDGEFTGFDIDLAKEAAKRLDMELKLQPIDWNSKDMELSSGAIDCIWNGFTINGREDDYTWTVPYMDNSQVFVVKASSKIETFEDLAGKIVTAQADSAALHALESDDYKGLTASFKELLTRAEYNTAFMELEAGSIDAIAMDIGVAKYQIEGKEDEYIILEDPIVEEQYGVGFLLGNTDLRDKVQATLEEMVEDGTFSKISNDWFGYDVGIIGK